MGITKAPVLPLPVSAWAKTSFLANIVSRVSSWMGDVLINPASCSDSTSIGDKSLVLNSDTVSMGMPSFKFF
ncbi:MAG: hypothetical protein CME62_06065 [Halobacteriovoraceae bacterium]|nr:hypothetical protein [Halobacteriovoraceae bacterium]|tara:strand:- start:3723 stop:3938 length:216 start_codon:yes stop_codon:yes gene_type:complete